MMNAGVAEDLIEYVNRNDIMSVLSLLTAHNLGACNVVNKHGHRPLTIAAWRGSIEMMEMLINHGADINLADSGGDTPIYKAAIGGQAAAITYLLEKGGDPMIKNKESMTPLDCARKRNHASSVAVLEPYVEKQRLQAEAAEFEKRRREAEAAEHAHQKAVADVLISRAQGLVPVKLNLKRKQP